MGTENPIRGGTSRFIDCVAIVGVGAACVSVRSLIAILEDIVKIMLFVENKLVKLRIWMIMLNPIFSNV
jgi:hypothetical protein